MAAALILALVMVSCVADPTVTPPPTASAPPPSSTPLPPTRTPLPPTSTPLPATDTPAPIEPPGTGDEVFRNDPASVVQAVFSAAQTQEFGLLSTLCDPLGEHDGDMDLICAMNAEHPDKESFLAFFAKARITGEPVIDGNHAQVPLLVGPDGDQEETMNLVQRGGKWYLLGF